MGDSIDLDRYFRRIGFNGAPAPDLATLTELHRLHPKAIAFENLSTLLREPIPLDVASLEDKLVVRGRGGYCFEQNGLFLAVLRAIGFDAVGLAARVVWGRVAGVGPRTHMVLRVPIDGVDYVADVGFGGLTLTGPLRLVVDMEQSTPDETFRLVGGNGEYELLVAYDTGWRAMYRFDLQEQLPVDFEVLNHFVASHPTSPFLSTLMGARRISGGRYALRNGSLSFYRGAEKETRELATVAEVKRTLERELGIALPSDPALDSTVAAILKP